MPDPTLLTEAREALVRIVTGEGSPEDTSLIVDALDALEQAQRDVERLRQSLESERQAHAAFVQQAAGSDCGCPYLESPGVLHFESCSQHDPERCPTCQVSHEHAALAQRDGEK